MFYEVRARLLFDSADEAKDFHHDCEIAFSKATVVNPGSNAQELSEIQLIENHHDEDPNEPCSLIASIDNAPPPPD